MDNVDTLAEKKNPYHNLVRGFGILPSRAMENTNRDYSDWEDEKMTGELRHFFSQCGD